MTTEHSTHFYLARQPIFDRDKKVSAYEVIFNSAAAPSGINSASEEKSNLTLIANTLCCPDLNFALARMVIKASPAFLIRDYAYALPCNSILGVEYNLLADKQCLDALGRLKDGGFSIFLDDYGNAPADADISIADIVGVDFGMVDLQTNKDKIRTARSAQKSIIARRLETHESFAEAAELGCDYFQGSFFQKPQDIGLRDIPAQQMSRLRVLEIIESEELDIPKLIAAIKADPSLAYRLLKISNSAAYYFSQKVSSIKHAVALLGTKQLRNWLRLIIITDAASSVKTRELSYLAAQRGKFLELAALDHGKQDISEKLFLLGLLSVLDAMVDMPMQTIVKGLPLDNSIAMALCGGDSYLVQWISLAKIFESGDWKDLHDSAMLLSLDVGKLARCNIDSINWASSYFNVTK